MESLETIRALSDREFRLLQNLIYREAGIFLADTKKALVSGRLTRRLRVLGLSDFSSYYDLVSANTGGELSQMIDNICTNETRFFREAKQFDFLERSYLPTLRERAAAGAIPKSIRVWSAACSTGEEPYSLAMTLATHLPSQDGWSVKIIASDLSTKVLATARDGVWLIERSRDIPREYLRAYMLRGVAGEASRMRAQPQLKSMIDFRQINLNDRDYGMKGGFDLIFCRNVLIYFDRQSKAGVVERLTQQLAPSGLLFLGLAESLTGIPHSLVNAGPSVYRK